MRKCLKVFAVTAALSLFAAMPGFAEQSSRWYSGQDGNWYVRSRDNKGNVENSWFQDLDDSWYLLAPDGHMYAGLIHDTSTGRYYYCQTEHDGFYGRMAVTDGAYTVNGRQVYLRFNQEHDGAFGAITSGLAALQRTGVATVEIEGISSESEAAQENEEEVLQEREVSEAEIDAFYNGSVLVGDSVMLGFRNYCMRSSDPFLKSFNFLASGSFSVHNALWPVSSKSVHPIYQGAQRPVWESLALMQAKKVFLFFGLNDLNMGNDTCECYQQVVANIKQLCPDAEIHIMSMTYTLRGKGKGRLNNDNIRVFNAQMKEIAEANGWGYIDLATPLSDANGDLAPEYCSDNYVHQTSAAYQVWTNVLRQYARDQLKYTPAPEA